MDYSYTFSNTEISSNKGMSGGSGYSAEFFLWHASITIINYIQLKCNYIAINSNYKFSEF